MTTPENVGVSTPEEEAEFKRLEMQCANARELDAAIVAATPDASAILYADGQQRGGAVQEFIDATDALLESQARKTWTSGYAKEMTACERGAVASRWCNARAALLAALKPAEDDTYTDENGTVWTRPTAWAYAQVCKARDTWQARTEASAQALADLYALASRFIVTDREYHVITAAATVLGCLPQAPASPGASSTAVDDQNAPGA